MMEEIALYPFWIRILETPAADRGRIFTRGFSLNLCRLIWNVMAGILIHALFCNILTVMHRPNYEKPITSPEDLVEKNITICVASGGYSGGTICRQFLANSPIPEYKILSERHH